MMNWVILEIVERIKRRCKVGGFEDVSKQITDIQISGCTPGEIFAGIAFTLNTLISENTAAYSLAKDDIDKIVEYAKSTNYL